MGKKESQTSPNAIYNIMECFLSIGAAKYYNSKGKGHSLYRLEYCTHTSKHSLFFIFEKN